MAFYLSPGVFTNEIDLTTTIPAVSTNISVLVVRQPGKGTEYEKKFVANDEELIDFAGTPTEKSYKDILAGLGFLKYGNMLYVSAARPADATFSGIKIGQSYQGNTEEFSASYTYSASGTAPSGDGVPSYDYVPLGTTDLTEFPTVVENDLGNTDDVLGFISDWRGNSANNLRVLTVDRDLFNAIKYHTDYDEDADVHTFEYPSGVTVSSNAEDAAKLMYESNFNAFSAISDSDVEVTSDYQFAVVIEMMEQGSSSWVTKELYLVSTDETERSDDNDTLFVEDVINERSDLVKVALNDKYKKTSETDPGPVSFGTVDFTQLTGGYDGVFGRDDDTVTAQAAEDAAVIEAYDMYSNPEELDVNLFIEADKSEQVKRKLIEICQVDRKDSMAILDVPRERVLNNSGSEANDLVRWRKGQGDSTFNPNTSYAAVYGNWIEIFDKWNKKYRWIPISGHVAGIYANTDIVADPWWAAAGLNRAILTNVRRLAWNPKEGHRNLLYKNGINPVVSFSGQGKVIGGNKTLLSRSSAFNRVNVRRLFLVLEKAISKASKYFVFEMNDEVTWMLMTNMIEPYLRDVQGRRGIYNFLVQIDSTVNTPTRIDRNELGGNIFIQPARSAEYIVLNFIATPTGANFDELIGAV